MWTLAKLKCRECVTTFNWPFVRSLDHCCIVKLIHLHTKTHWHDSGTGGILIQVRISSAGLTSAVCNQYPDISKAYRIIIYYAYIVSQRFCALIKAVMDEWFCEMDRWMGGCCSAVSQELRADLCQYCSPKQRRKYGLFYRFPIAQMGSFNFHCMK